MNYPIINSERCQITIATTIDADWLYVLLNDIDVYKFIEGIRPFAKTVRSTIRFIDDMLYAYNNGCGFLWKLLYKDKPIGFICTFDLEDTPSLCYGIVKTYRNNGFMSEALMCVLRYQTQLYNESFRFIISQENVPSLCLYKKIAKSYDTVLHIENKN